MRNRRRLMDSPSTSSQTSSPLTSPRKSSQRQIPHKKQALDNDDDDLAIPNFAPLPGYPMPADLYEPQDLIIWRRPAVFALDVARPQRMHAGPIPETPISMLYDVFAKKVEHLERQNILANKESEKKRGSR
ncbi:hypothetical protein H0H81_006693 [Sphagnurus paluster]|uniref:Uncharacterized protein n=1 Tax=Sphagnurus paluster TaxID=117069 RepID=A0A9P7K7G1_9AGAR|nr:hypothetical protein H0H81_006693 [Sphagnurus paluster]